MPRALVLGGTGSIGRATARRLLASGWDVDLTGRDPANMPSELGTAGARFLHGDRGDPAHLAAAMDGGVDLLVDNVCYTAEHARLLLPLLDGVGSTVLLSSKAVYVDDEGRHSNSPGGPRFRAPIRETQPTMAPSDVDYRSAEGYGANKVAAEQVMLDSDHPVTVIRPSKVHGAGSRQPREWMFVKRALDRRPAVFLAHRGTGVDHPTAAANIAALIEVAAGKPGARILNCADPDAPSALGISRAIARLLGHDREEVLLAGEPDGNLGRHCWDRPQPIVLDMTAAAELGYVPAGDYATTVAEEVDWLVAAAHGDEHEALARLDDEFFAPLFDYEAEDRYLASR